MAKKTPEKTPPKNAVAKVTPPKDNVDLLESVALTLTAEFGRPRETMEKIQDWEDQSLVELEKSVGESIDIRLNCELFARGEVVTVGENFGVRIIEIVEPE
jgi:flagellar motor switch protein FliN/FliY